MKKIAAVTFAVLLIFSNILSPVVLAEEKEYTKEQLDEIYGEQDIKWFKCGNKKVREGEGDGNGGGSSASVTGASTAGEDPVSRGGNLSAKLMEIKDATKFAEAIDTWIKENSPESSPFRNIKTGEMAIAGGKRAGINPILPLIISRMESTFGIHIPGGNNAYGRTATASQPHIDAEGRMWYAWDTLEQSLYDTKNDNDMYMYLKEVYSQEMEQGIEAVMMKYAPPNDGNDTVTYINNLKKWSNEIYDLAGDSINKANLGTPGATSVSSGGDECDEGGGANGGATTASSANNFVIYYQTDYPNDMFHKECLPNEESTGSISDCGCGTTSLAMVMATLLNDKSITPVTVTEEARQYGYVQPEGTDSNAYNTMPAKHGLKSEEIGTDMSKAKEALSNGKYVIANPRESFFTGGGHFIVLRGLTASGNILVGDPNKKNAIEGNRACNSSTTNKICINISANSSSMKDLNGDGKISYTENSIGFTDEEMAQAGIVKMWVIGKDDIRA